MVGANPPLDAKYMTLGINIIGGLHFQVHTDWFGEENPVLHFFTLNLTNSDTCVALDFIIMGFGISIIYYYEKDQSEKIETPVL